MANKFKDIYEREKGCCQNCGTFIFEPKAANFAHVESKNLLTEEQKFEKILFICQKLHFYEHTKANNLKKNLCVKYYLTRFGDNKKFLLPLWDEVCQQSKQN
jgi:hypothetical protein